MLIDWRVRRRKCVIRWRSRWKLWIGLGFNRTINDWIRSCSSNQESSRWETVGRGERSRARWFNPQSTDDLSENFKNKLKNNIIEYVINSEWIIFDYTYYLNLVIIVILKLSSQFCNCFTSLNFFLNQLLKPKIYHLTIKTMNKKKSYSKFIKLPFSRKPK